MTEAIYDEQSKWMEKYGVKKKNIPYPVDISDFTTRYGITEAHVPAARIAREKKKEKNKKTEINKDIPKIGLL